jgi:hypothetical protein
MSTSPPSQISPRQQLIIADPAINTLPFGRSDDNWSAAFISIPVPELSKTRANDESNGLRNSLVANSGKDGCNKEDDDDDDDDKDDVDVDDDDDDLSFALLVYNENI